MNPESPAEMPAPRVDERDVMFSRAALVEGTESYEAFYRRRSELKATDDALRSLTPLLAPGSAFYQAEVMAQAAGEFEAIGTLTVDEAWVERQLAALAKAGDPSSALKAAARSLGAVAAGWAPLDPAFVYTHKGRFPEEHGRIVALDHPNALVFLVEMDWSEMQKAPKAATILESARQYRRAAAISLNLEALLEAAGFRAKRHYDAHYDVILPPLAVLAGLGEMGRNNLLIADRRGGRVRIGCVTTDFPAVLDRPVELGARRFCEVCLKCAENCPSRALETGPRRVVRGVEKWPTEVERCYRYWRQVGTDCGVCMAACPFSHKDTPFHNLVRWMVRRWPWSHRLLVLGDAMVYGRRWRAKA